MTKLQEALSSPVGPDLSGFTEDEILEHLATAEIVDIGLHPEGSNYVFVVQLDAGLDDPVPMLAIYKPKAGERPLRDFPRGTLHLRERAAYILSRALGWPAVPPTVLRDGPHGPGSMQLFIHADRARNYFSMRAQSLGLFEPVAGFDHLVRNADRKGGACLVDAAGKVWAIDQGLTFNPYARVRTVMFEFCGRTLSPNLQADLQCLSHRLHPGEPLSEELCSLLGAHEITALNDRLRDFVDDPVFPILDSYYNVPWPMM